VKIVLLGTNHQSAPLELRERLAVEDTGPPLQKLVGGDEVEEAVLLSTCNRVEVVALTRTPEGARRRLHSFFSRDLGGAERIADEADLKEHLYEHSGGDAVGHVMRVASALDSMVVGEPQILGQTKEAYRAAVECGACGPILSRLFQSAFAAAKRVRSETRVGQRPVSVARVAVELAENIFEDFADKRALLIGAGEMIEMALRTLRSKGLDSISVANRTPERAAELAAEFGATAHGLGELPDLLPQADVVLTSIGGARPILTPSLVSDALHARRNRPIFVIDIGVPRNADPEINRLDNVYLYDIDDLASVADENAEERRRETVHAEAIVVEERQRFDGWFTALRAVPTIRHLCAQVEEVRRHQVDRALARHFIDESQREAVDALTRSIVKKILHAPISRLRREAEREEGMAYLEAARVLFDLDADDDSGGGGERASSTSGSSDSE
jgi:glutamyl-tRNA reductase